MFSFESIKLIKKNNLILWFGIVTFILIIFHFISYQKEVKQLSQIDKIVTQQTFFMKEYSDKRDSFIDSRAREEYIKKFLIPYESMHQSIKGQQYNTLSKNYFKLISDKSFPMLPFDNITQTIPQASVLKTGELDDTYDELKIVLDNNITPLNIPTILTNPESLGRFDGTDKEKKMFTQLNQRYYTKGFYFIWSIFIKNISLLFLTLVILLFGINLALELNYKNKTIDFLIARKSKLKIFMTKCFTANILGILFVSSVFVSVLSIIGVLYGFGSLKYPVLSWIKSHPTSTRYNSIYFNRDFFSPYKTEFVHLDHYLFKCFIILSLSILFVNALCFFISIISKNVMITIVVSTLITFSSISSPYSKYSPLTFLNIDKTVSNYLGFKLGLNNAYQYGIFVLLFWSIALYFLSFLLFKHTQKGN